MYKPYNIPVFKAFPDIKNLEPRFSKFVFFLIWLLGRLYLFLYFGVVKIVLRGDSLIYAFKRALAKESRCIVAFRHPNAGEPQILTIFFLFKLRALARKKGVRFALHPHAVSVYGYEVVRWGGWVARLVMPNIGCMSIHHSKMDTKGMNRIYKAIVDGPYPLAIAPEGQVSYTTDSVPRLEAGVIRIGFNAAQQLEKIDKNCPVEILPVSIHFRFGIIGNSVMEKLIKKIEKFCGFSRRSVKNLSFTERLRQCRDYILEVNEKRYGITNDGAGDSTPLSFEERLEKVINAALETAEQMLGLKPESSIHSRMYRVRQICWDRIFLPDVDTLENISQIERSTLDLKAGEAWYIARHQELVDFCFYFRAPIPTEETALHSKIEYVQNLWDFANRTMGGAIANRKNILIRRVIVQASPVINISERLPQYRENRKEAVAKGLEDLKNAYLNAIEEIKSERNYYKK